MSPPPAGYTISLLSADEATQIVDTLLVPLWEDVYAAQAATDSFLSTPRFLDRFHGYAAAPGFSLVTARTAEDGRVVGVAFGYTLQPNARWWNGLRTSVPDGFTDEDGHRTFAINELMVTHGERRRRVATALHDALLAPRPESRATLLVDPENTPARRAYVAWGWHPVGSLKPFPDSPTYESMTLPLPLSASRPHASSRPLGAGQRGEARR
ncbi:MAG: GNAT family N-acetyltransferase [Dermatophilaceae bacterium]